MYQLYYAWAQTIINNYLIEFRSLYIVIAMNDIKSWVYNEGSQDIFCVRALLKDQKLSLVISTSCESKFHNLIANGRKEWKFMLQWNHRLWWNPSMWIVMYMYRYTAIRSSWALKLMSMRAGGRLEMVV